MRPLRLVPIMLNAERMRILIVGGGAVALRRVRGFLAGGVEHITIVAPDIHVDMPAGIVLHKRGFAAADIVGHGLVVAATDQADVNAAVVDACARAGVLCCRADNAALGDFIVPAVVRDGVVVAGVSAGTPAITRQVAADIAMAIAPHAGFAAAAERVRGERIGATQWLAEPAARSAFADEGIDGLRRWLSAKAEQPPVAR